MNSQRNQDGIVRIKELAKYVKRKVNLLGVVLEFSFPRKSQGSDYVCILKIVDDSQQSPELLVNIFTNTIDQLPHVQSPRDLILLKNVMIKKFEAEVSAVFYKDSSSFALFDGKPGRNLLPYQSSQSFKKTEVDEDSISCLRHWCVGFEFSSGSGSSDYLLSLKDISENSYFDLICKVLHVSYDVSKGVWMLFVWDGTDVPPLKIHGKIEDEEQNPLPLHIESSPLDRETLRKFFTVGTVLRVTADQSHENFGRHFTATGKWVKIRNMSCQVTSGMWHGLLQPSSRVRLFSNNDNVVWDYMRRFKERIPGRHGRMPMWTNPSSQFLTAVDWKDVTFVTLMEIVTHRQANIRGFCIVRVVAIHPSQAEHYGSDGSSEYIMKLTLEDPTNRIHALLCGEEWVKFFGGSPPTTDVLTKKIKMLLGVSENQNANDGVRNPPWIKCGLHVKESDGGRNRLYYIRWTKLVTE